MQNLWKRLQAINTEMTESIKSRKMTNFSTSGWKYKRWCVCEWQTLYSNRTETTLNDINPLDSRGNYSATSNNMKLVHWPLMGGLLHLEQRGTGRGRSPPRPLLAVPNVTAQPSTASLPITVLRYNGPLLCSFNIVWALEGKDETIRQMKTIL